MKWYALTTYSGYEKKIQKQIEDKTKGNENFGEILVPTDNDKNKTLYSGYIFIEMNLKDETWHIVRKIPKVTGFVGNSKPQEVSASQIAEIKGIKPKKTTYSKYKFAEGDEVKIVNGAFMNFSGKVESIDIDKRKLKVLVGIFGRATSVELAFENVEK